MITFANGTSYETVAIYGSSAEFQSAKRDMLEICISTDNITLDEAKEIWQNEEATAEITISYEVTATDGTTSTETSVHLNYTLPVELKENLLNDKEVIRIKLAQKSALELTQEAQAQDIEDANAALVELAEIVAESEA